jgi:Zn finger protein HypA/HybF involved in hydrogenase expression
MANCKECGRQLKKSENQIICDNCLNFKIDTGYFPKKYKKLKNKFGF